MLWQKAGEMGNHSSRNRGERGDGLETQRRLCKLTDSKGTDSPRNARGTQHKRTGVNPMWGEHNYDVLMMPSCRGSCQLLVRCTYWPLTDRARSFKPTGGVNDTKAPMENNVHFPSTSHWAVHDLDASWGPCSGFTTALGIKQGSNVWYHFFLSKVFPFFFFCFFYIFLSTSSPSAAAPGKTVRRKFLFVG